MTDSHALLPRGYVYASLAMTYLAVIFVTVSFSDECTSYCSHTRYSLMGTCPGLISFVMQGSHRSMDALIPLFYYNALVVVPLGLK